MRRVMKVGSMRATRQQKKLVHYKAILVGVLVFLFAILHALAPHEALSYLYHATTRAAARNIMKEGINPRLFNRNARMGKKFYVSTKPGTALAEKGNRSTLLRYKASKYLKNNLWDLRKPESRKLHSLVGKEDLRGTVKNGVIGPKLGQKIGSLADRQGKAIKYRSVKNGGTNIAISGPMIRKHPRTIYDINIVKR